MNEYDEGYQEGYEDAIKEATRKTADLSNLQSLAFENFVGAIYDDGPREYLGPEDFVPTGPPEPKFLSPEDFLHDFQEFDDDKSHSMTFALTWTADVGADDLQGTEWDLTGTEWDVL